MIAMHKLRSRCAALAFLFLALAGTPAGARMYQWTDPDTGTPQLSGKPPWWYRTGEAGPRIYVIDNGRVIDDTSVAVPEPQRLQLRESAFRFAEEDEARLKSRLEEERRLDAERARRRATEELAAEAAAPPRAEAAPEAPEQRGEAAEMEATANAEAMRALVEAWEKAREESAKVLIHE
jgi:hypothetical protein